MKEQLRQELSNRFHKSFWQQFAEENAYNQEVTQCLFDFITDGQDRLAQTSSEIIRYISDINPEIVVPHIDALINTLEKENCHDGVKRCIFRMFQRTTFSEAQASKIVDIAFHYLQNRNNAIAIRVFAMTTIYNLTKTYPELYSELEACITENLEEESAGFRNRAGKILNRTWK